MSVYTEYDNLSDGYDRARRPKGADVYLGIVYSLTKKTAENLHIMDLGCGTGNHAKFLMDQGVQKVTLLDASAGMIAEASNKFESFIKQGRVTIQQHKLPSIPFEDDSFDVIMCNQVLHHLVDLKDTEFATIRLLFKEAFRVLKRNGVFLVNSSSPMQCRKGLWFAPLFPDGTEDFANRSMDKEKFLELFRDSGFQKVGMVVQPLEIQYSEDWYFNKEGPLNPAWRKIDSVTATASEEDVKNAEEQIRRMKKEGTLEKFFKENDQLRQYAGQFALYYAKKN